MNKTKNFWFIRFESRRFFDFSYKSMEQMVQVEQFLCVSLKVLETDLIDLMTYIANLNFVFVTKIEFFCQLRLDWQVDYQRYATRRFSGILVSLISFLTWGNKASWILLYCGASWERFCSNLLKPHEATMSFYPVEVRNQQYASETSSTCEQQRPPRSCGFERRNQVQ